LTDGVVDDYQSVDQSVNQSINRSIDRSFYFRQQGPYKQTQKHTNAVRNRKNMKKRYKATVNAKDRTSAGTS